MAELFIQISVSLDNYIEDANGDIEWMAHDTPVDHIHTETLRSIEGMIFGRKAHALLAKFWPVARDNADYPELAEQTRLMNALPKYVLTHGKETTGWANSHAIGAEDFARLKAESSRPLALFAGAKAVQTGMESGLVDEIRLIRYQSCSAAARRYFAMITNGAPSC